MDGPPETLLKITGAIDSLSDWTGKIVCLMIFPLVGGLTWEVVARYGFDAPTSWAYDTSYMLYGSHFMLGAAYTLLKGGHIRTDFFYEHWSTRRKGTVDSTCYLLFFFPGMFFFLWMGTQEAMHSWSIWERSEATPWRPWLFPFKTVIPVAALLILIQGVSELIKSLYAARTGRRL